MIRRRGGAEVVCALVEGGSAPSADELAALLTTGLGIRDCTLDTETDTETDNAADPPKSRSIPIFYDGARVGTLRFRLGLRGRLRGDARQQLRRVADVLGPVVHTIAQRRLLDEQQHLVERLSDELRSTRLHSIMTQDEERRSLERDLHDGAQHHIVALRAAVGLLEHELTDGPGTQIEARLALLDANLSRVETGLLATATGTLPVSLVSGGLLAAFDAELSDTTSITLDADETLEQRRYPLQVEVGVFYACLEAVNNASKHAPGAAVTIELRHTYRGLRFAVFDNGPGFDAESLPASSGLAQLGDRIAAIGGELALRSRIGVGTVVSGFVSL